MNSQPARFGELLSSAWTLFRERLGIILPGAAIFAVITTLTQLPMSGLEQSTGMPTVSTLATSIIAGIIGALVGIISGIYFLVAVIRKESSVGAVLSQVWPRIIPFIGLSLLTLIKTYSWIAILGVIVLLGARYNEMLMPLGMLLIAVGVVCAVIFGPRYMLGGVLWLVEGKGVKASVDRSYQVTTGYWGKIVGNCILVSLIFMVVMILVGIVAGIAGAVGGGVAGMMGKIVVTVLITGFVSQCYSGFMSAFLLKLTATIVTNPRTGGAAPSAPVAPTPVKKTLKKPQATMKKAVKKKK